MVPVIPGRPLTTGCRDAGRKRGEAAASGLVRERTGKSGGIGAPVTLTGRI